MGIRKGTKLSEAHKKAIAQGLRKAVDQGWKPNATSWAKGLSSITPESQKKRAERAGKTMSGRPQRMDSVCGKHENNKAAKWWCFYNKGLGKELQGKNLNQIVRDNAGLFDPKDLNWDTCGCNAVRCLRNLTTSKRPRNSWKGWMVGAESADQSP